MTQRREFLRQASLLAAGTVAAGSLEPVSLSAQDVSRVAPGPWDLSWVDRVTGKFRMCFDAPSVSDGISLHQVRSFLSGYADAEGLSDADLTAVLVIRHAAIPMALDDELWSDGAWGAEEKLKDPVSGETAKRNPFVNVPAGSKYSLTWSDGALDTLQSRGVIVLACDLALQNISGQIARRRKIPREDARQLVLDHLLPGITRMPSGIYATCRAQGAGCGFMYSA